MYQSMTHVHIFDLIINYTNVCILIIDIETIQKKYWKHARIYFIQAKSVTIVT